MKKNILLVLILSCSAFACSMSTRDGISRIDEDDIADLFERYKEAAKNRDSFEETLEGFFIPEEHQLIKKTIGWARFVYDSGYRALKYGECEEVKIIMLSKILANLDCTGTYNYFSPFLGESKESMQMRFLLKKQNTRWYLSKSGFRHTHRPDLSNEYKQYGIKF